MGVEVGGWGTEKETISLCESIGHRPLWRRSPATTLNYNHNLPKQGMGTADHLTLLRLFIGSYPNLEAQIPALRFRFQPQIQIFAVHLQFQS